jgi:hypothetical protein
MSSPTALSEPALYILLTFHVPNLMFIFFRSFIQGIRPGPRPLLNVRNHLIFYGEHLLAPRPTPKVEDHPLSAVRDCLLSIFAAALQDWKLYGVFGFTVSWFLCRLTMILY